MTTATVQEVQDDLVRVLARVRRGHEVAITNQGETVARLVPAKPPTKRTVKWPDFESRLRKQFPKGTPPGAPTSRIVARGRADRV